MGSLRSLRRKISLEEGFQPSSADQPDLITQMGLDLVSACLSRNWLETAFLLSMGADPNFVDPARNLSILEFALLWDANVGFVKLLLRKGADVSKTPDALLGTFSKHQVGKTELLLKHGADPNVRDTFGRTPLMRSLWRKERRHIRPLVKYGADLDAVDSSGTTALMEAAETNNSSAVRELLKYDADPDIRDSYGKTAMERGKKWWLVVKAFEDAGIKV